MTLNKLTKIENYETSPLGKHWWVRLFRKRTEKRINVLENQMRSIINSLGLIEPEEGERELSLVDRIEKIEQKIQILEGMSKLEKTSAFSNSIKYNK